ncbi:MAG: phage baseplate assembly protein V [Acidimicrobiia bacterium]
MSLSDRFASWFGRQPTKAPIQGVRTATVVDHADPNGVGRVLIAFAGDPEDGTRQWARTATLMAGPDRGTWFIPDIGDEVLVAFEHGDPRYPVVVGSLWHGHARPPEQMGVENGRRGVVTRSGARIMIDDTGDRSVVQVETGAGQRVTLDDGPPSTVTIADGTGNTIVLDASGVAVTSSSKVTITASAVTVTASQVALNCAMVDVAGVLKCDTMIANNVVASSYTPGVGNTQ